MHRITQRQLNQLGVFNELEVAAVDFSDPAASRNSCHGCTW